jgi:hypothetical protein
VTCSALAKKVEYSTTPHKAKAITLRARSTSFQIAPVFSGGSLQIGRGNEFRIHRTGFGRPPAEALDQILNMSKDEPVMLYDDATRRSWIISKLSVMLLIAHIELKERGIEHNLPVAEEASNDGDAAANVIRNYLNNLQDNTWPSGDQHYTAFKPEMLSDTLKRISITLQLAQVDRLASESAFVGHEILDIALTPTQTNLKIRHKRRRLEHWKAFASACSGVLFCANIGEIMEPGVGSNQLCTLCKSVPHDQDHVVVSVETLKAIARRHGGEEGVFQISSDRFWNLKHAPFSSCSRLYPSNCLRVQTLSRRGRQMEADLKDEYAVIFGEDKDPLDLGYSLMEHAKELFNAAGIF